MKDIKKSENPIYKHLEQLKKDKFCLAFQKVTILLLLFGVLSFIKMSIFQIIPFYIFGIWTLMLLCMIIKITMNSINIKLDKRECIFALSLLVICFGIYIVMLINTKRIYTWDQCCYYNNQVDLLETFKKSFLRGIEKIRKTTYNNDYGYFLLSFTSLIFSFTTKTPKAFILTYTITEILPVMFVLFLNIISIYNKLKVNNKSIFIMLSSIVLLTFPLLHKAAMFGQPDIFGLFWVGIIILVTTNYKFEKRDFKKYFLIIISSFFLTITRRWYIFWMLGYYVAYGIFLFVEAICDKNKDLFIKKLKNVIEFGIIASIIMVVLLFPIIDRTIKANYSVNYAAWNKGGLVFEVKQQESFLGIFAVALMVIGIVYGIYKKDTRFFILTNLTSLLFTSILFTRVQNSWYHQSLIYVSQYVLLLIMGIGAICQIKNRYMKNTCWVFIFAYLITAEYGGVTENKIFFNNAFYSNVSIKPEYRQDYEKIGEIVNFIKQNCDIQKDRVYPNFATGQYCGHTLSQYLMPDTSLRGVILYESSIDSVHGFPEQMLTSKYVILANQILDGTSARGKSKIIPDINNAILNVEGIKNKFKKVIEYDLENGIILSIYERIEIIDDEEAKMWKEVVKEQDLEYPQIFSERINSVLEKVKQD